MRIGSTPANFFRSLSQATSDEIGLIFSMRSATETASVLNPQAQDLDEQMIQSALGPLVRINDGTIQLVHQSLKDFSTAHGTSVSPPLSALFAIDLPSEKIRLAHICLKYLSLEDFRLHTSMDSELLDDQHGKEDSGKGKVNDDTNSILEYKYTLPDILFDGPENVDNILLGEKLWNKFTSKFKLDYAVLHWADDIQFTDEIGDRFRGIIYSCSCSLWSGKGAFEPLVSLLLVKEDAKRAFPTVRRYF